jgi:2'-deoxynucleoside 5'-phosphate N-hydrolase
MNLRVYISGAFVGSQNWEAASERYELLSSMLKDAGFTVYLPHAHTDPILKADLSPEAVFTQDRRELRRSDVLVALLDEPSHGVGAEVCMALCNGMTVLGACSRHRKVSRFIQGMLKTSSNGVFFEYEDLREVVQKAIEVVTSRGSLT